MKRCPACGTVSLHGGEFCSKDGTRLMSVAGPQHADQSPEPPNATLLSGSLPSAPATPTTSVENGLTGSIKAGSTTIALGLGDSVLIGAVLAERYRLDALIGRGGMGVVYRARHLLLDRPVAVKLLRPQYLEDERAVQRFMREAQAMARVEHRNAVTIHDFGMMPDGGAYLVMEYIEGETLRALLTRVGTLAPADAVAVADQICGAVDAAHRQGVVHRDLKPENIMFKRSDDGAIVKVVDFGLAKVTDPAAVAGKPQLTSAGDLFGTPAYMAPEFFEGEEVGARADVYSIGVITYEMLMGTPPFQGTVQTIMSGHLFKDPPAIRDSRPLTPPGVDRAIRIALRKRAAERFGSAADFASRLNAGLNGHDLDRESVPTGLITIPIKVESLRDSVEPDGRARAAQGGASDHVETIGGPNGKISTGDILEPEASRDLDSEAIAGLLPPVQARRRRVLPGAAAAAIAGAVLVGGVAVTISSTRRDPPPIGNTSLDETTPDIREIPLAAPNSEESKVDSDADDESQAADAGSSTQGPSSTGRPTTTGSRPVVSRMEVVPTPRSDRSSRAATSGEDRSTQPKPAAKGVEGATQDDQEAVPERKAKSESPGSKDDTDKSKKKRKWYNPFSW